MFKVNDKDTRATLLTTLASVLLTLNIFYLFYSFSIAVAFEQVSVCWVIMQI